MYRVFIAGHATGTPSPGGYGIVLTLSGLPTWEQDGVLESTFPLEAPLIAVREALRAVPEHSRPELVTSSALVQRILQGQHAPRRPEVAQVLGEIRDLARLRDLEVRVTHTGPGTMVHLARAQALAEAATARARRSANSPACPRCGDRMAVREVRTGPRRGSRVWGCTNFPDCRGTIPLYEPRD